MTDFGITATGFVTKSVTQVRAELTASVQAKRGASFDMSDGSLVGQFSGILSEREGAIWDLAQATYSAGDADAATDAAQEALCALSGTFRAPAKSSVALLTLTGTPTTSVPAGSQIKTVSIGDAFATNTTAVLATLAAWAQPVAYNLGDRVTNSSRAYQCIVAGTSTVGGPTSTLASIVDGGVTWTYLGEGTGAVDVKALSVVQDAIVASARDLTAIQTPVGGWQSAINLLDASLGAVQQTNESLRVTRESELAQSGTGTPDAIKAELETITGVTSVIVLHNDTDAIDVNGQPPHTTQALIVGGDDSAIAQVLYQNIGAGLTTYGNTSATVVDTQGTTQTYNFTRLTPISVYVDVTLTYNPATPASGGYPTTGDALVKAALVAFGVANLVGGKDVVSSSLGASIFPVYLNGALLMGVQGVLDVARPLIYTDVIGASSAWVNTHGYVATPGSRSVVTNDGGRAYICITSGTSAGSGGPTGTGSDITDGTVHWAHLTNTLVIDQFHMGLLDTSRIAVHSTAGSV